MKTGMPTPSEPRLTEVARKVVAPSGIVSTGWPSVENTCRSKLGLTFDRWQSQSGRLALAKRADGKFAATVGGVGMSVCRQAGKTHWLTGLTFGFCINRPGTLVVWSAHHAKTHGETFLAMSEFAERQRVAPYIEQVFRGSGAEEIRFRNGSRILFGAREHGFGRGIPGVDIIVADEAQIMSERAVDAMIATMNTSDVGLAFYIGTPPRPEDNSESFTRMRTEAWEGTLADAVWIEFGAAPGSDPNDPETWRVNPSYPHRTPRESMLRLQRKLSPDSFLREGLGIWVVQSNGRAIRPAVWGEALVSKPDLTDVMALGLHMNSARTSVAIVAAFRCCDGSVLLEEIPAEEFNGTREPSMELPGTAWIAPRMKSLWERWKPEEVLIHGTQAAASLITAVEDEGVPVTVTSGQDMARACGQTYDALENGTLKHLGQDRLTAAALAAKWKDRGETRVWDWKDNITAWIAGTLAVHGLVGVADKTKKPQVHSWPAELLEEAQW